MRRVGLALAALATFLVVPSTLPAQSSGSYEGRNVPNFETAKTFEGQIVRIEPSEGLLLLGLKGKEFLVEVHEKTKLKADKKTGLHKKEDLTLQDFPVGSRVKLTVRTSDGRLLEMRLRELAKS